MRADRLLSLLMLLQHRGRMTARTLATELEVSERTIYRDIDALSAAGVPVYAERGRDGGFALVEKYRTDLTGLSRDQVRALFTLSIPTPLSDLGLDRELKAALLKLAAALPDAHREDESWMRRRFHLDSSGWHRGQESVPHLRTIQQAVWHDCRLSLSYRLPFGPEIEHEVEPYALVAKAGVWYLVCARKGRMDVHRVADLVDVSVIEESFERPTAFELASFWRKWCIAYEALRSDYAVRLRVAPGFVPELSRHLGSGAQIDSHPEGKPDAEGWVTLELSFRSFEAARAQLLAFGRGVEVLGPPALRLSVADFARQTADLYGT